MELIEFVKELDRMCDSYEECAYCGLYRYMGNSVLTDIELCRFYCLSYPDVAQEVVQEWAEKNPVKTRLSVFLEAFPNAPLNEKGIPMPCTALIFGDSVQCTEETGCVGCWNKPIEE